jgi:hypothetical protein
MAQITNTEQLVEFMAELVQDPEKVVTHSDLFHVIHLTIGCISEAMASVANRSEHGE